MSKLVIIGAGGHGKVVADAAQKMKQYDDIVFLDARFATLNSLLGFAVIGDDAMIPELIATACEFVVAIGDNRIRARIFYELVALNATIATVVHPSAQIGQGVSLGSGSVVFANTTINPDTSIGRNVIVNTGTIVEHDCVIEDHVHLAPNSTVTGGCRLGEATLFGASATVIPNKVIGKGSIIGAGATVVKDIPENTVATGIPARW